MWHNHIDMSPESLNDTPVTLVAGVIGLVLAAVLMFYYWRSKGLLDEMWAVDTYDASELRKMCSGGFNAVVEIQGQVSCESPIIAPASTFPCCWCRTRIDRRMRQSGGRGSTENVWEKAYEHTASTIFKVTDLTGHVLVDPANAQIDTEDPYTFITSKREDWFPPEVAFSNTGEYRVTEEIFVPTGYVYVLGEASSCQDGPDSDVLIHRPGEGYTDPGRRFFVISRKSEKELTSVNDFSLRVCFWAGIAGFMFAAYCILHAFRLAP